MTAAAFGMTCLGIVMAYVSMYFISRLKKHTVAGLAGIAGVLLGGVVGQFLVEHTPAASDTIWWYPIGLLLGLLLWGVVRFITTVAGGGESWNLGAHTPEVSPPGAPHVWWGCW